MKKPTNSKNSAFSLIELMLVIGIIGILSSFAVPKFNSMIIKAKQLGAVQLASGALPFVHAYLFDNQNFPGTGAEIVYDVVRHLDTACSPQNIFGFGIDNCKANNYTLGVVTKPGTDVFFLFWNNRPGRVCPTNYIQVDHGYMQASGSVCKVFDGALDSCLTVKSTAACFHHAVGAGVNQ